MSKIEKFDEASMRSFMSNLDEDLKAIKEKYGIDIEITNRKYSNDDWAEFKCKVTVIGGESRDLQVLKQKFPQVDVNKILTVKIDSIPTQIKLIGYNTRKSKYPIIVEIISGANKGKRKLHTESVVRHFYK